MCAVVRDCQQCERCDEVGVLLEGLCGECLRRAGSDRHAEYHWDGILSDIVWFLDAPSGVVPF